MFTLTRSIHNPILSPNKEHFWESAASFNGCPIRKGKTIYMVYRAMGEQEKLMEPKIRKSTIGIADSKNGYEFNNRRLFISPDADFDKYGCEDPRIAKVGTNYVITYTALGGYPFQKENIRVGVAVSKDLKTITEKHLVTPFNSKAMAIFPEKINGKIAAILTVNTDTPPSEICYAEFDSLEQMWDQEFWNKWKENLEMHKMHIRRYPTDQLELGAPPLRTEKGWLVVYSHIQRYGRPDQVFGIEVVLLDFENPRKIIGRTKGPFMIPDAYYEKAGLVQNVIFPTGSLIEDEKLKIYYGAADTHSAIAEIPLETLLESITEGDQKFVSRFPGNPIITPRPGYFWEQNGTLNPAAIDIAGKTHIFYRAVADSNISTLGYACSYDGLSIDERSEKPVYFPRVDFEKMGCEDPRLIEMEGRIYMFYTGYDGITPRVAVSSIDKDDFIDKRWSAWSKPEAITAPEVPNKDAAILPEKVKGKYMVFHRASDVICADLVTSLDFSKEKIDECIELVAPRRGMWDGGKVGISCPPVKTADGWLLLYHGVSWSTTYRVGAVLLDLNDPTSVISRTAVPIFEPEEEYELKGLIPNVVFPCGLTVRNNTAFMYYGGGDSVIGVATMKISTLLKMLKT